MTSEDINRFKLSLDRMRVTRSDGFQFCRLNVLTDDKTGLDEGIRVVPYLGNEEITNPNFHAIELHNYDDYFGTGTKTMYFDANCIARDLTQGFCFDGIPDRGTTHETNVKFSREDRDRIEDENLAFLHLAPNWWGVEENAPKYSDAYFGFVAGDTRDLYRKFMSDPAGYQTMYNTLGEFYENEFEGYILPTPLGMSVVTTSMMRLRIVQSTPILKKRLDLSMKKIQTYGEEWVVNLKQNISNSIMNIVISPNKHLFYT